MPVERNHLNSTRVFTAESLVIPRVEAHGWLVRSTNRNEDAPIPFSSLPPVFFFPCQFEQLVHLVPWTSFRCYSLSQPTVFSVFQSPEKLSVYAHGQLTAYSSFL